MPIVRRALRDKLNRIKLLICDVDGVLTDGRLYYDAQGEALKVFHVHDGYGIKSLLQHKFVVSIISARHSEMVKVRMQELGIKHIYQAKTTKLETYHNLRDHLKLTDEEIAVIGDDIPDKAIIEESGLGIAVANARLEIKDCADYVTQAAGGHGAVREIAELLIGAHSNQTIE